jgi:hypothetical protein
MRDGTSFAWDMQQGGKDAAKGLAIQNAGRVGKT